MALILVQPGVMFKGSNELTRSPAKWPRVKDCSSSPARLRGLTREASEAETSAMAGLKEIGGSFSAEHGIGLEKRAALARHGDPVKLRLMRELKRMLDPDGLMNPGKVL